MKPNLTPEDAALMGLPILSRDRGDPHHWEAPEFQRISLGLLFQPSDDEAEGAGEAEEGPTSHDN
ncbi:hypothetical protein [Streptomyces sp. NPDC059080]|uniref:hypothetical protein n=1 Tax=Streptomyces sp. NPDC059080 TaxID=3346718 RepID=UPI0036B52931